MIPPRVPALIRLGDDPEAAPPDRRDRVVVIGNFDGVHRGHQAVLKAAARDAEAHDFEAAVLTFDPHPSGVLGRSAPPLLATLERRVELVGRCGIQTVFVRHFDRAFAAWSPHRFVEELLRNELCAVKVVVGANFRFGSARAGNLTVLRELAIPLKIDAQATTLECDANGAFSSTRAREALARGDLAETDAVLGRHHSIMGRVAAGAGRGRQIGFPTANLTEIAELIPKNGVYSVLVDRVEADRPTALARGVMNIGVRPTFEGDAARSVEVHLFDHHQDLYGAWLRVHLVERIRDERKFANIELLKAQIEHDADQARRTTHAIASANGSFG